MPRFINWIISLSLAIGVGSALAEQTYKVAKAAVHAHKHDQMSYSKFTRAMTEAKPRQKINQSSK